MKKICLILALGLVTAALAGDARAQAPVGHQGYSLSNITNFEIGPRAAHQFAQLRALTWTSTDGATAPIISPNACAGCCDGVWDGYCGECGHGGCSPKCHQGGLGRGCGCGGGHGHGLGLGGHSACGSCGNQGCSGGCGQTSACGSCGSHSCGGGCGVLGVARNVVHGSVEVLGSAIGSIGHWKCRHGNSRGHGDCGCVASHGATEATAPWSEGEMTPAEPALPENALPSLSTSNQLTPVSTVELCSLEAAPVANAMDSLMRMAVRSTSDAVCGQ